MHTDYAVIYNIKKWSIIAADYETSIVYIPHGDFNVNFFFFFTNLPFSYRLGSSRLLIINISKKTARDTRDFEQNKKHTFRYFFPHFFLFFFFCGRKWKMFFSAEEGKTFVLHNTAHNISLSILTGKGEKVCFSR